LATNNEKKFMTGPILTAVLLIIVVYFLKIKNSITPEVAREHLKKGARLIDVRSAQEYHERHLPGSVNLPLSEIRTAIEKKVPDKNTVVLLHCLSGGRSGMAAGMLKRLGYAHVYNLGSYSRAEKIVRAN
jgi:phage shock protein E